MQYFSPLQFSPRLNPVGGFGIPRVSLVFSPRVKAAESGRGGVWGGLGSPLAGLSPNTEISFLMISPKLLDICSVFLLVFSPLETADFFMLLSPSGDGYSLLCSQNSSFHEIFLLFLVKHISVTYHFYLPFSHNIM